MTLATWLPPVMPVLWPLMVALTVPLPLALTLPAARYALICSAVPYRLSAVPLPLLIARASPALETFKLASSAQLRLAPLALKASVTGPAATKGVLPKGSAALTPGVVLTAAGNTKLATALPPKVCVPAACKATVVDAAAPLGAAARAKLKLKVPAGPL